MRKASLILATGLLVLAAGAHAEEPADPPLQRGIHVGSVANSAGIDTIAESRLTMQFSIPIGQSFPVRTDAFSYGLVLSYHSEPWELISGDSCPTELTRASATPRCPIADQTQVSVFSFI